jgi:hypothetical protein
VKRWGRVCDVMVEGVGGVRYIYIVCDDICVKLYYCHTCKYFFLLVHINSLSVRFYDVGVR